MPELLLELFSEEIPARMQARAADDLARLVIEGLKAQGLACGAARAFATPRRLALVVADVPALSPAVDRGAQGPARRRARGRRAGLPQGGGPFLARRGRGRRRPEEGRVLRRAQRAPGPAGGRDRRRGRAGGDAEVSLAEVHALGRGQFPMGAAAARIVCLLDGAVVPFEVAGVGSGATTRGHRFHGDKPFEVAGFADYARKLKGKKVLLSGEERAALIAKEAQRGRRRRGSRSSRTRRCWPRTPVSPNGRRCSWAPSTKASSRCPARRR